MQEGAEWCNIMEGSRQRFSCSKETGGSELEGEDMQNQWPSARQLWGSLLLESSTLLCTFMVSGVFVWKSVLISFSILPAIPLVLRMCGTCLPMMVDQYVFPVLLRVVNWSLLYPLIVPFTSRVGEWLEIAMVNWDRNRNSAPRLNIDPWTTCIQVLYYCLVIIQPNTLFCVHGNGYNIVCIEWLRWCHFSFTSALSEGLSSQFLAN